VVEPAEPLGEAVSRPRAGDRGDGLGHVTRVSTRSRDFVPQPRRSLDLAAPTRGARSSRHAARLSSL